MKIERRYLLSPKPGAVLADGKPDALVIAVRDASASGAGAEVAQKMIVGYSAKFGVDTIIPTYFGEFKERIKKGAFRRAIREMQDVRGLRNHDPDNLLGRTASKRLRLSEDDIGLYMEIDPSNRTVYRDTIDMIETGDMTGQSFAFIPRKVTWISGENGQADLRIIEDVDLYDVGPVTYPAYDNTTVDAEELSAVHELGLRSIGKTPSKRTISVPAATVVDPPEEEVDSSKQEEQPAKEEVPNKEEAPATDDAANKSTEEVAVAPVEEVAPVEPPADEGRAQREKLLEAEDAEREANENRINMLD